MSPELSLAMKNNKLAIIYALLAVAMWSTVATAFKLSLGVLSLLQLLAGASVFSTLVLGLFLSVQGTLGKAFKSFLPNLKMIALLGLLNPILYYLILFKAYDLLLAQVAQSLNYTWAITLTLLSVPLLKHALSKRDLVAVVCGYIGVVFISFSGKSITGELNLLGIFLALLSTLIWALYWLLNARDKRPPIIKLFQSFLLATPALLMLTLLVDGLPTSYHSKQLIGIAYVGIVEMGLAFICWQLALHYTDKVSRISTLIFLSPFISLFIIHHVLSEPLYPTTFIGLGLIVFGLLVQQSQKASDEKAR